MPLKDLEKRKEYNRNYYLEHEDTIKLSAKRWQQNNRERHNKRNLNDAKRNGYKHQKRYRSKLKYQVLIHYGGNPPKCACCGEDKIEFLTMDHNGIIPDKHFRSGNTFYRWLIRNNYPEGFRVLCLNCNFSIGHFGYCPHNKGMGYYGPRQG